MNTLNPKIVLCIGLMMLFEQQTVVADHRPNSHRDTPNRHWNAGPAHRNSQFDYRFDRYPHIQPPSYKPYYKPGYQVNPLPYGHTRIVVNNAEYFFYDGYFYRPSRTGYVIVEAPVGAIVFSLPRLHQIVQWHGQPYYIAGNTFYRRHPRGYVVVPEPGFGYRR